MRELSVASAPCPASCLSLFFGIKIPAIKMPASAIARSEEVMLSKEHITLHIVIQEIGGFDIRDERQYALSRGLSIYLLPPRHLRGRVRADVCRRHECALCAPRLPGRLASRPRAMRWRVIFATRQRRHARHYAERRCATATPRARNAIASQCASRRATFDA